MPAQTKVKSVSVEMVFSSPDNNEKYNLFIRKQDKNGLARSIDEAKKGNKTIESLNFCIKSVTNIDLSPTDLYEYRNKKEKLDEEKARIESEYEKLYIEYYGDNDHTEIEIAPKNVTFDTYEIGESDNVWGMWSLKDFKNLFQLDPVRCIVEFFKYDMLPHFRPKIESLNKLKACLEHGIITLEEIHQRATDSEAAKYSNIPFCNNFNQMMLSVRRPKMWKGYTRVLAWENTANIER